MKKINPDLDAPKYINFTDQFVYVAVYNRMAEDINLLEEKLKNGENKDKYQNLDIGKYVEIKVINQNPQITINPTLRNAAYPNIADVYSTVKELAKNNKNTTKTLDFTSEKSETKSDPRNDKHS